MNMSKATWLLWTILIVGLWLVGACGGNPTTPNPSDVQDFTYDEGGDWDSEELTNLIDSYNALVDLGGGVATVVDENNYTLIGVFDRWSGNPVTDVQLVVEQPGEDPVGIEFSDKILFSDLVYPITVTVWNTVHVTQTIIETNANVIAFGMERRTGYEMPATVIGYTFNYTENDKPWLLQAASTHTNWDWVTSTGFYSTDPNTILMVNPYQPVGAVAFLYQGEVPSIGGQINLGNQSTDPDDYTIQGISYSHIGTLDPGSVGGWIINLDQEGTGNEYTTGNYAVNYSIPPNGTAPLTYANLVVTPGGWQDDSCEFIPYYPPTEVSVFESAGTYDINAYDPPVVADHNVIRAEITYADGGCETQMVAWDPAGAGVPNLTFGDLPLCSSAVFSTNPTPRMFVSWTNDAAEGMQVLTAVNQYGHAVWRIFIAGDATQLPDDGIVIPPYYEGTGSGTMTPVSLGNVRISVSRIECAGVTLDGFDRRTVTNNATSTVTSVPSEVLPEPLP